MSLGIYVHIPFCIRKCPYCDFVSYPLQGEDGLEQKNIEDYVLSVLEEAAIYQREFSINRQQIKTLYIGGGTPTCLSGGQLFYLLDSLQHIFEFAEEAEITVEGNPGTIEREKLEFIKKGGCNRLSLGVQSFAPEDLSTLGRIHSLQEVYTVYELAKEIGFTNISLDLMYGLPGQDIAAWRKILRQAVELMPEHLSLYQLNIEKGTPFYLRREQGLLFDVEQEMAQKMLLETIEYLTKNGYRHYEISNFSKVGRESKHNKVYWQNCEYLGLGAGASGYWRGVRYSNEHDLARYRGALRIGKKPVREEDPIDRELSMSEHMFLGLRLLTGVEKEVFYNRFGIAIESVFGTVIKRLKGEGLLFENDKQIRLTKKGLFLANFVFMEFLN
jgi:oxygen-independent coproporphyrinogen-3 oxidase